MKRTLAIFAVLIVSALGICRASEPVSIVPGLPESGYDITQSTVALSSFTVTSFAATSHFRQLTLIAPTSFFYRLDGSTLSLTTVGFPVAANTKETIESNGAVKILLPVGISANTLTYIQKKK